MKRKTNPLNDPFSAHEALDRAHLASAFFSDNVAEHTFVQAHPKLRRKAERLADALGGFYQDVGRVWADVIERSERR